MMPTDFQAAASLHLQLAMPTTQGNHGQAQGDAAAAAAAAESAFPHQAWMAPSAVL